MGFHWAQCVEKQESIIQFHLCATSVSEFQDACFLADFDFSVLVKQWYNFVSSTHYLWLKRGREGGREGGRKGSFLSGLSFCLSFWWLFQVAYLYA